MKWLHVTRRDIVLIQKLLETLICLKIPTPKRLEYSFFFGPEIKLERPKLCIFLPGKVALVFTFRPRFAQHIHLFRGPTKFKTSKAQSEIILLN